MIPRLEPAQRDFLDLVALAFLQDQIGAPPTRVPQRIVLVTPAMRAELAALKEAGFTRYLIKPVRAGSLAARLSTNDGFEAS